MEAGSLPVGRAFDETRTEGLVVMLRRTWLMASAVLVAAVAVAAGASAVVAKTPSASSAGASTAFCNKVGVTGSVARKIFGRGATPSDYKGPSQTYCQITPGKVTTTGPVTGCESVECTDVFILGSKSVLASDIAYQVAELKEYGGGHVSQHAVAGAGPGAVLVTDTKYGDPTDGLGPALFLQGGSHTIAIQGSLGGPPVLSKWEKLAGAIHTHLG
jgi:hypothetical protein